MDISARKHSHNISYAVSVTVLSYHKCDIIMVTQEISGLASLWFMSQYLEWYNEETTVATFKL